jgi:hypothetical protein
MSTSSEKRFHTPALVEQSEAVLKSELGIHPQVHPAVSPVEAEEMTFRRHHRV